MLKIEKNYEFRKALLKIHEEGVRDYSLKPSVDEIEIKDGFMILLPENPGRVILTAAKDFVDYLFVSLDISAMLKKRSGDIPPKNAIYLEINESVAAKGGFSLTVSENIILCGHDERGIAQGLYYLEERMNIRKAPFVKKGEVEKSPAFSPRMVHSGYGLDDYPEEYLSKIAHSGMDAILVFTKGVDTTPRGYMDFNALVYRAEKYGIDVYAYSYLKSGMHPHEVGAQAFYDGLYGSLFESCPGLKGIVLVGESVEFPSRDKHVIPNFSVDAPWDGIPTEEPRPGWWPCWDYPDWLETVKEAIYKHKSDADIVFWTYNWGYAPEKYRVELINKLPTDISLLVTYEMFEKYDMGGITEMCSDYTLSFAGPGKYFVSEAKAAKERGIRLYSMANTAGLTWDFGVIPYEPMPYQWIKRYKGLIEAKEKWGLSGIMESHHFGFYPSFISELTKRAYTMPLCDMEEALVEILSQHYGENAIEKIKEALKLWSEAITYYTPTNDDQYCAFRIGPAYPFCLDADLKPSSAPYAVFGNGIFFSKYLAQNNGRFSLVSMRVEKEKDSLCVMLNKLEEGVSILETIKEKNDELLKLINLGKFMCVCTSSGINSKKWYMASMKLKTSTDANEIIKTADELFEIGIDEIENSKSAIPLVGADSRLGWEPSMEYAAGKDKIIWKIRQVEYTINVELNIYRKCADYKEEI